MGFVVKKKETKRKKERKKQRKRRKREMGRTVPRDSWPGVVLQVGAYTGEVQSQGDTGFGEVLLGPNTTPKQDSWCIENPGRENHFVFGGNIEDGASIQRLDLDERRSSHAITLATLGVDNPCDLVTDKEVIIGPGSVDQAIMTDAGV